MTKVPFDAFIFRWFLMTPRAMTPSKKVDAKVNKMCTINLLNIFVKCFPYKLHNLPSLVLIEFQYTDIQGLSLAKLTFKLNPNPYSLCSKSCYGKSFRLTRLRLRLRMLWILTSENWPRNLNPNDTRKTLDVCSIRNFAIRDPDTRPTGFDLRMKLPHGQRQSCKIKFRDENT